MGRAKGNVKAAVSYKKWHGPKVSIFYLFSHSIIDSLVFLVNIPFDLIYMNSSISKMRSVTPVC